MSLVLVRDIDRPRSIHSVGILLRPNSKGAGRFVRALERWLRERGRTIAFQETAYERCAYAERTRPDLIVSLGGDGTMLQAAKLASEIGAPVLGVNFGNKGFLTQLGRRSLFRALERVFDGQLDIERRRMLDVEIEGSSADHSGGLVLNDVVISKGAHPRALRFEIELDGRRVLSMRSDGLVISTPTGSTAYSLAAGGPIVHPALDALIVTPICPHTLTQRPLVVPTTVSVRVRLGDRRVRADVALDGQSGHALVSGGGLSVRPSPAEARFVRLADGAYFDHLHTKLRWGRA
jgi:NAD+ kinase